MSVANLPPLFKIIYFSDLSINIHISNDPQTPVTLYL